MKYDDVAGIDHIKADVKEVCSQSTCACLGCWLGVLDMRGPCRSSVAVLLPMLAASAGRAQTLRLLECTAAVCRPVAQLLCAEPLYSCCVPTS